MCWRRSPWAWLFLVAQYESWTLPASVMLSVLFAIGGALLWLWTAGYANDVYVQIDWYF
ncbi:Efflux pump membrane transporter BepG [Kluyvera cryocrescens]|uniref:Efflux pump membrane transporter BepG n=1 Tax=Kluyvera cryocrescens TaxID=580 RepID=A0A485CIX7_KLUCR|nr:Efflux pump membrane transporter BepG [Kluyvera cryocrescens]